MSDIPSLFPLGSRAGSYLRRVPPASRIQIILIRSDLGIIDTLHEILFAVSPVRIYDMVTKLSLHFQVSFHFSPHFFLPVRCSVLPNSCFFIKSIHIDIVLLFFFWREFLINRTKTSD
jgi:hypothetical protein